MRIRALMFVLLGATQANAAASIDFSSSAGLAATCAPIAGANPSSLRRDDDKVAYAICSGVALATEVATWWRRNGKGVNLQRGGHAEARALLEKHLATIARVRTVLEGVKSPGPYFVIEPGKWEIDFDGDGQVSMGERHFFWTPRRGVPMRPMDVARSQAEMEAMYASPVVRLDRSDVLWATAYCNFVEAALHLVLAYDYEGGLERIALRDAERIRTHAHRRLAEGIRVSMRLRQALLEEKDDDREWIANPRQGDTAFPLVMDEQTFATWGRLLDELQRLVAGKTLLGGTVDAGGMRGATDLTMGFCPPGQGIDVRGLFQKPLDRPLDAAGLRARCTAPSAAVPMSGLAALASESLGRNTARGPGGESGEWQVLRHLYWVN